MALCPLLLACLQAQIDKAEVTRSLLLAARKQLGFLNSSRTDFDEIMWPNRFWINEETDINFDR